MLEGFILLKLPHQSTCSNWHVTLDRCEGKKSFLKITQYIFNF